MNDSGSLAMGLVLLAVVDAVVVIAVMMAVGVPLMTAFLILLPIMAALPLVIAIIMRVAWPRWWRDFPAVPPRADAVVRTMQSFSFGGLRRFNNVLTIAADEDCLHLALPRALRWTGCRPMSIPWSEIREARRRSGTGWITATVRGHRMGGPAWCMSLALAPDDRP